MRFNDNKLKIILKFSKQITLLNLEFCAKRSKYGNATFIKQVKNN